MFYEIFSARLGIQLGSAILVFRLTFLFLSFGSGNFNIENFLNENEKSVETKSRNFFYYDYKVLEEKYREIYRNFAVRKVSHGLKFFMLLNGVWCDFGNTSQNVFPFL